MGESDRKLTKAQRHALAVIAAGEHVGRPARVSDHTTAVVEGPAFRHVHWRTARELTRAGLVVDGLNPHGDGLRLTPAGRAALEETDA